MKYKAFLFGLIFAASLGSQSLHAIQDTAIQFRPKLLAVDANEGIDLADVNQDGKLDVIAGREL